MTHSTHPQVLVSLAIIRNRAELTPRSTIRSVAMFTVTRSGEDEAWFDIDHAAFDGDANRAKIIDGICDRIPRDATVLVQIPRIPKHYLRDAVASGQPLQPADAQLIQRHRQDIDLVPIDCVERQLVSAAQDLGLPAAATGAGVTERARRAPDRAQLLWQLYLHAFFPSQGRTDLTAAWQAWREIERARLIPF